MKKIPAIIITLACVSSLLPIHCANPNAGNGSDVGNARITAMLYNPGGTPAVSAKVCFYPHDNDPRPGKGSGPIDSTTTDSSGNYTAKLDSGTYNILASGDSGLAFQDSIRVLKGDNVHPPADTLKAPGTLRGVVQLQPGDDPRAVFILFMGTHTFIMPDDSLGNFASAAMAEGKYRVRILTTIPDYQVMDTSVTIKAGRDSILADTIKLKYTGVPTPKNLEVFFDTLHQIVVLFWDMPDTSLLSGYNVYRSIKGQNFSLVTQTPLPKTQTMYYDTGLAVGAVYEYRIVSRTKAGIESKMVDIAADTALIVSASMVTTSFLWNSVNTIHDTSSINDTVKVIVNYSNPTRKIDSIEWYLDTAQLPRRTKIDSLLSGKDSLTYFCPARAGLRQLIVKAVDAGNTTWKDTFNLWVIQDAPKIVFLSGDTIIDHGGTVRCSVSVQQQFGTMTVEIDTANTGNYKGLGSLGLTGGKSYIFPAGKACSWDSVKVRITDDDGDIVVRGYKVDIRPQPLTITSVDSTVNAITVHFSQTQETDFKQYRIYRNTTSAVDTTSELWATIATAGTVSYTTPTPGYAWTPRYYRVYQKDNEGMWSMGSNAVYGCIINSPPTTPVITYPANDGDTIWSNALIKWSKSNDLNGNGIRYLLLVNYNNTGYAQFRTELIDTFIRLGGFDSLGMRFKVIAYDTLGDSSAWSGERMANLKYPKDMRLISGGTFSMGQTGVAEPVHSVTLSSFYMDTTEVTQTDYLALMGVNPSYFTGNTKRPVENMTWLSAVLYCNKRSKHDGLDTVYNTSTGQADFTKNGYRLPTEAEWEYACRAGTTTYYYWGNSINGAYCWYYYNSGYTTQPVATRQPNAWGLYDMSGNVYEWCNDWYGSYTSDNQTDPTGPTTGSSHVVRGGSWASDLTSRLYSAYHDGNAQDEGTPGYNVDVGFRCVRSR